MRIQLDQLLDDNELNQIITTILRNLIPIELSNKISSKRDRKLLLDTYGESAFLLPKKLKFPVINPNTGDFDCSLIYAARIRLRQYSQTKKEYKELIDKADALAYKNNCNIKIPIQIYDEESNDVIDFNLLDIVEILLC